MWSSIKIVCFCMLGLEVWIDHWYIFCIPCHSLLQQFQGEFRYERHAKHVVNGVWIISIYFERKKYSVDWHLNTGSLVLRVLKSLTHPLTCIKWCLWLQVDVPGGGVTAGLTTAKTVARVILRDLSGKFCWENSVLYGPPWCHRGYILPGTPIHQLPHYFVISLFGWVHYFHFWSKGQMGSLTCFLIYMWGLCKLCFEGFSCDLPSS